MDNSPLDRGLSLTLSWGAGEARRHRTFSLGALLRIGAALALCAACYQTGRWHGQLEVQSERSVERPVAAARLAVKPVPSANTGAGGSGLAPGQPAGESEDKITPLNARDPSALVMGPGSLYGGSRPQTQAVPGPGPAPEPQADEPPPTPPARVYPRPSKDVKPSNRF